MRQFLLIAIGVTTWLAIVGEIVGDSLASEPSVDFEIKQQSLPAALATIEGATGEQCVIDHAALNQAGLSADDLVVSRKTEKRTLGDALDQLLSPSDLTWFRKYGVIWITSVKAANQRYETRIYKVTRRVPVERRMRSIVWNVAPDTWAVAGGRGDAAAIPPKHMLIRQSPVIHREIAATFANSIAEIPSQPTKPSPFQSELQNKLASPTTLKFSDVNLETALNKLATTYQLNIVISDDAKPAVQAARLSVDVRCPSLADAISLLLELNCPSATWGISGDSITIGGKETSQKTTHKVMYNVESIIEPENVSRLSESIEYAVAPSSWEFAGGNGRISQSANSSSLEVIQGQTVHRQIETILRDLRADAGQDK